MYDDAECKASVSTFCQFFVEKVNRIIQQQYFRSPSVIISLCICRQTAPWTRAVVVSASYSRRSPTATVFYVIEVIALDVLPCTLLKSCADVFAPVITTLANL